MRPIRAVRPSPQAVNDKITARSAPMAGPSAGAGRRLCRVNLTVRPLTINRRARPAVVGGGLVAVCAAVAATVAALTGGPAPSAGALPAAAPPGAPPPGGGARPAAAPAAAASVAALTGGPADPRSHATLSGATTLHLV